MKKYIHRLIARHDLSREESYDLFLLMEQASVGQQASVLAMLRAKGETVEEILGARDFFFKETTKINLPDGIIDIVGTGGDEVGTFNISTAASLVIASCGVMVTKHGGKSATSQSGSVDVCQALGIDSSIHNHNYTYLQASLFNQALPKYASLRRNLGFPTIFNILGPLMNPASPKRHVIGVYRKELAIKVAEILKIMGSEHALVVHSQDGLDEFSVSAPNYVAELKNGNITQYMVNSIDVGIPTANLSEVLGGSPLENANIIRNIFMGKITGAKLDIVLLNSAAGLVIAGMAATLHDAVDIARDAISSGKTFALLNKLQMERKL